MDSEYKRVAEGVKSDSPDASIDFPVPFNMISGDSLEKKNSYKQTDKYANGKSEVLLADAPKEQKVDLELTGGRYDNEGYIRVRVNKGKWTTVCSDHWTIREALVACNQIGNFGQAKQAVTVNFYGGETENRDIYRIKCVGRETNLSKCNLTKADDEHVCSKKRAVAGIVCSKQLPDLVPNLKAIEQTMRLQDQPLYYLRCSMEENCLSNSAYVLRNTSRHWRSQYRRLMRFSTIVRNEGTADFRPVLQRSAWQWHACHMHYHSMEVFAHYDIMDANGNRLAEGSKASFCLEDTACDSGVDPTYNCRGFGEQGLSVNCSDNYMYNIDCQWIDVTDIKPGHYTFLMEINPDMLVPESSFDNNVLTGLQTPPKAAGLRWQRIRDKTAHMV
ncbi:hypothetical protein RRG08_030345 [Elysia crispata]|uniref:protein-lysine 6-oxidase n=1 Tax=Elysia crispata TaxID=231223 RepID=A0AAE1CZE0_9GAST|nr:hypothetical protein RRG08_030345 [Elysia crispata]